MTRLARAGAVLVVLVLVVGAALVASVVDVPRPMVELGLVPLKVAVEVDEPVVTGRGLLW